MDFGIAKAMQGDDQKVTKTGLAIGTPEYMSPEQLGGDQLDSRTDIYSLGLVTFNMLTGQLPFPSVVSREALIMRLTEKPRTLAEIRNDVQWPPELQTVMDKALANHPADRYQHVSQFGRELVTAVATMPESAFTSTGTVELVTHSPPPPKPKRARSAAAPQRGAIARTRSSRSGARGRKVRAARSRSFSACSCCCSWAAAADGGTGIRTRSPAAVAVGDGARHATTAPPVTPPVADSARQDSASCRGARHDSPHSRRGRSPAADSAAPPRSRPPSRPRAPSRRDQLDDLLAPIREDLNVGKQRMNEGQYEGAVVRFGSAQDRIAPLARKYADVPQIRSLRREINEALSQNHAACKAERDLALEHGSTSAPECP